MSYCRWSSDDFQCDVYVYADAGGGWTTHVAGNRVVYKEPLPPVVSYEDPEAWATRHNYVMRMVDAADRVPIDLLEAGETYNDPTAAACADRLETLRAAGFVVPQYAIDELRKETPE
jgi:hypothetical protein